MRELMLESGRPAVGTLAVTSPYDGRELAQLATAGVDHVDVWFAGRKLVRVGQAAPRIVGHGGGHGERPVDQIVKRFGGR